MTEEILTPLTRPPDRNPERSMAREALAQSLERMAARVRADDGDKRFYAWSTDTQNLDLPSPGHNPETDSPNAQVTAIRITWRKE